MKIKNNHFQYLSESINSFLSKNPTIVDRYETGDFHRSEKVKDLNKRFRSDLLAITVESKWVCDNLYPYLTDIHIDTALRHIVPIIKQQY